MIAFSSDDYPLVLLDMGRVSRTDFELLHMFAEFRRTNERARASKTRYVLVAMTRLSPGAHERRIIATEANSFSASDRALCAAAVIVVQNSLLRGVMTALGWLMPSFGSLMEVVPNSDRAIEVAAAHLVELGVALSAEQTRRATAWLRDPKLGQGPTKPAGQAGPASQRG
jgi:hypothetical protein